MRRTSDFFYIAHFHLLVFTLYVSKRKKRSRLVVNFPTIFNYGRKIISQVQIKLVRTNDSATSVFYPLMKHWTLFFTWRNFDQHQGWKNMAAMP